MIGVSPDHDPGEAVIVWPWTALPEIVGSAMFVGVAAVKAGAAPLAKAVTKAIAARTETISGYLERARLSGCSRFVMVVTPLERSLVHLLL